jgi:hypothetical protein
MTDIHEDNTDPTPAPRPQTMLMQLNYDELERAYSDQATGQLVLGLESIEHKLAELVNIGAIESEAYRCIDSERWNLTAELGRRRAEATDG